MTKIFGKISKETCISCGEDATHYIQKLSFLGFSSKHYCKKCWLREINKINIL